jgi:PKD repeat protein
MTATVSFATLQASAIVVILVVASLYAAKPENPISLDELELSFKLPPIGPDPGNNTTDPGDNQVPFVDAGLEVTTFADTVEILRGSAVDPDGRVELFEWDADGDGTYDWSDPISGVAEWTYEVPGNYTAVFRATDDEGAFATDTVSVVVRPMPYNLPPVAFAGDDVTVDQWATTLFNMVGSDADGTIAYYEWDYDGDGTYDEGSQSSMMTFHIYDEPGVYSATLRVTDDHGTFGTDSRTVTVREMVSNQLPVANAGLDKEVEVGQTVSFVGTGSDPDGWITQYKWDFDGDGAFDWFDPTTGTVEHTYEEAGEYTAMLLVLDNNDTAGTDTVDITVNPLRVNQEPTADAGPEGILSVIVDEEVEFFGTGNDPDGTIMWYEWDFDGDGSWDWGDMHSGIIIWIYEEVGLYMAQFRVTDDDGATAEDMLRVQVEEDNPGDEFWPSDGKISIGALGTWTFDPNDVETVRPDIFRENHFSLFDILVHLDKLGEIDLVYHFDEDMNTHVIDSINDIKNWWYFSYYHMGWQETNNFRMDHYPYKDKTTTHLFREDPSRISKIHSYFKEEVDRVEANDGKVIIPKVTLRLRSKTLTFTNVEVTAHNLRNDTFQDGVITAIDVILSLADQEEITYKLTWYEKIGQAEILNYFVDGINDNIAHGTCGFVYEEGSEKLRWGNHIHIPSDYRIINSPEYEEWFWICL